MAPLVRGGGEQERLGGRHRFQGHDCGDPDHVVLVLQPVCKANCADGNDPKGGLMQGTDGNFYGTTQ